MNDEIMLTLHCPQCKKITDVVTVGDNLVCLDCGWKFDENVAARFLESTPSRVHESAMDHKHVPAGDRR